MSSELTRSCDGHHTELKRRIDLLTERIDSGLPALKGGQDGLAERVVNLEARFDRLDAENRKLWEKWHAVELKLDTIVLAFRNATGIAISLPVETESPVPDTGILDSLTFGDGFDSDGQPWTASVPVKSATPHSYHLDFWVRTRVDMNPYTGEGELTLRDWIREVVNDEESIDFQWSVNHNRENC